MPKILYLIKIHKIQLTTTKMVEESFDCEFDRYIPDPSKLGDGSQREGQKRVFELKDGATLSNCIIGIKAGAKGSADGIRCMGSCNINNVWSEAVGEDAITFYGKNKNSIYRVNGGGARNAKDKVFQFDGMGTAFIEDYYVENYVRLFRCCGNCKTQYQRHVVISNLTAINGTPGQFIVGINSNYGDTAKLSGIKYNTPGVHICKRFNGVTGGEAKSSGTGPDGKNCLYNEKDVTLIKK
ncbi:unnamed protein product [Meloidogyne enterolobii]|uniref:Uncharacterized protein n=2 Tax=Meloidogyne enterolobii TaxID=390850 RepID=A0ACB1AZ09_MELEN